MPPGGNTDLELQGLSWFSDSLVPLALLGRRGLSSGWPCFTGTTPVGRSACTARTLSVRSCNRTSNRLKNGMSHFRRETMSRFDRLTTGLGDNLDLIVWPEAATPFVYEMEPHRLSGRHGYGALERLSCSAVPALRRHPDAAVPSQQRTSSRRTAKSWVDTTNNTSMPFGECTFRFNSLLFFLDKHWRNRGLRPVPARPCCSPHEKSPPLAAAATNPDFHLSSAS